MTRRKQPREQPGFPGWKPEPQNRGNPGGRALIREGLSNYMTTAESLSELLGISLERAGEATSRLTLREMSRLQQPELARALNLTGPQSYRLAAALTLAQRLEDQSEADQAEMNCPENAVNYLSPKISGLDQEELHGLYLNTRNKVEVHRMIYRGNVNSSMVRPSEVLRPGVISNLPALIIAHNHPTGDPTPSGADISITKEITEAGRTLGIEVLDHLVLGSGKRYVSMKEQKITEFPQRR